MMQRGGGSDFMHSANSVHIQPRTLSDITLANIDKSPMFNPLMPGTIIPTAGITGIYPQGIYYMNQAAKKHCHANKMC